MDSSFDRIKNHLDTVGEKVCPPSLHDDIEIVADAAEDAGVELSPYMMSLMRLKREAVTQQPIPAAAC